MKKRELVVPWSFVGARPILRLTKVQTGYPSRKAIIRSNVNMPKKSVLRRKNPTRLKLSCRNDIKLPDSEIEHITKTEEIVMNDDNGAMTRSHCEMSLLNSTSIHDNDLYLTDANDTSSDPLAMQSNEDEWRIIDKLQAELRKERAEKLTLLKELDKLKNARNCHNSLELENHSDQCCAKKLEPQIKRMDEELQVLRKFCHKQTFITKRNGGKGNDWALLINADEDGKATLVDDIRLDLHFLRQAAEANTMRKRLNAVLQGLWTKENRLKMFLAKPELTKKGDYRLITDIEVETLIKCCITLQQHQFLDNNGDNSIERHCREWVSKFLKSERDRTTAGFRRRQERRKGIIEIDHSEPKNRKCDIILFNNDEDFKEQQEEILYSPL